MGHAVKNIPLDILNKSAEERFLGSLYISRVMASQIMVLAPQGMERGNASGIIKNTSKKGQMTFIEIIDLSIEVRTNF